METVFTVAFAGNDCPPRQVPSRSTSASVPPARQVPFRSISRAQRDRKSQAEEWHSQLIQMDKVTTKMLSKQIAFLTKEQEAMKRLVVKAMFETRLMESFFQHLYQAQRQMADDLKTGCGCDDFGFDGHPTGISSAMESSAGSSTVSAVSIAIASIQKSNRLMVHKIENLGVRMLQEVLGRIGEVLMTLAEHHAELHLVGRAAIKALQESEIKVKKAWEKYFSDATLSMNSGNRGPPQLGGASPADSSTCFPARQLPARRSSFKVKSTITEAPQRGVGRTRSGQDSYGGNRTKLRTLTPERVPRRGVNRNNNLRAMASAADLTLATTDVWLSEWSYRSHVMEQANLWEGAAKRTRELFLSIQITEVTRRIQFSQDLLLIVKNQQKLAVNLEAASALGLMEYWEGQHQISEEKGYDNLEPAMISGSPGKPSANEPLVDTLALPLFPDSCFVTLTALVKRGLHGHNWKPVLSVIVVTIDGLLYFFDLPAGCNVPFDKSSSATQGWEAIMKAESKKQALNKTGKDDADSTTVLPPPVPSLCLVLARCSVEMTGLDCVVKIGVPESHGEHLRIELTSTIQEIAFVDAFHACKFADDDEEIEGGNEVTGTDSISDVSCSVNGEF